MARKGASAACRRLVFTLGILVIVISILCACSTSANQGNPTEQRDRMTIDQLGQEIQPQLVTEYFVQRGGIIHNPKYACKPRVDVCLYVDTKATDAKKLASLTMEVAGCGTDVGQEAMLF